MRKDLHNNPLIFWLLAAIAVGSFIFAIYTFEITKPSRDLVYRIYAKSFNIPDNMSQIEITGIRGSFRPNSGYIKEIYIWNNGNFEIEPAYLLRPIKIEFDANEKPIEIFGRNINSSNFTYEFNENKLEIKFDKLLPKAGFVIRYFSDSNAKYPQIEGLIADPIRGASTISNASIVGFGPQSERTSHWLWEVVQIFFLPVTGLGIISALYDIKPQGKIGMFIRNIILYTLISLCVIYIATRSYDFVLARPPI